MEWLMLIEDYSTKKQDREGVCLLFNFVCAALRKVKLSLSPKRLLTMYRGEVPERLDMRSGGRLKAYSRRGGSRGSSSRRRSRNLRWRPLVSCRRTGERAGAV